MVKTTERSTSTGYFYDLPKIGRAQLSRHFYDGQSLLHGECIPHNIYQQGGAFGFESTVNFLLPIGKTNLIAVIVLLVLHYYKRYNSEKKKVQKGGVSYINTAENMLSSLGINSLAVIAGLLLLNHFAKVGNMVGGKKDDNEFWKRLIKIIDENNKRSNSDSILRQLYTIGTEVPDLPNTLDQMFKGNKTSQKGGSCDLFSILQRTLKSMNIDSFLKDIGLESLTKKQKGGGCGCPKEDGKQYGGAFGEHNCGLGNNALEVVGDKALYYNNNLTQFGCTIPSWGDNLVVAGQGQCI